MNHKGWKRLLLAAASVTLTMLAVSYIWLHSAHSQLNDTSDKKILIGISQPDLNEPRQVVMNNEIRKEAAKYKNVRLIFTDAAENSDKQAQDVERLMKYGIDLLVISLNDSEKLTPIVAKVYQTTPVIVLGRGVSGYDYSLFIGPDNNSIGKMSGKLAASLLSDSGGGVVEIQGLAGSPSLTETSNGFYDEVKRDLQLSVIKTVAGDWQRDKAQDEISQLLPHYPNVRLIFAHSDAMALGAYYAVQSLGLKGVHILGIDGLDTVNGGFELVKKGILSGTVTSPTGGKEAIQYAIEILGHEKVLPKKIILRSHLITQENAEQMLVETERQQAGDEVQKQPAHPIRLGVAVVGSESSWRNANTDSITQAAEQDSNIKLIMQNAEGSQSRQIQIIRDFIQQKVDAIAFSPIVETGWDEVLTEAKQAGIPVLLSDRTVKVEDDSLWTTFIGSDFVEEGRRAARWLIEHETSKNGPVRIAEIQGTEGSAPAIGRMQGFKEVLQQHNSFQIVASKSGDFTYDSGKRLMEDLLKQTGTRPDVVFAHNDDMALGAISAMQAVGLKPGKDILVLSVDATKSAFQAMEAGKLNMSVECNPLLGPQIMKAVKELAEGREIPKTIITSEGIFSQEDASRIISTRKY
ncbi:MAG: Periplasmic binding protein domain containing protein [Bacilli bacterium]|nr:Periplasmic binding protein domain containing protein [Bacilli bacterium]